MAVIRLDNFGGGPASVDPKLYVVITTANLFATGSWKLTAATLPGFPSTGRWLMVYEDDGVMIEDGDGNDLCTLKGLQPMDHRNDGDADVVLTDAVPYAFAKWCIQEK